MTARCVLSSFLYCYSWRWPSTARLPVKVRYPRLFAERLCIVLGGSDSRDPERRIVSDRQGVFTAHIPVLRLITKHIKFGVDKWISWLSLFTAW